MAEDQKLASASGALQNLFGTGDENVRLLEKLMDVHVALRGGDIVVEGGDEQRVDGACVTPPTYACSSVRYSAIEAATACPPGKGMIPAASEAQTAITHNGRVSPSSSSRREIVSAAPS